jgi:hypothetical protein
MSDDSNAGCIAGLMLIGTVASWLLSGYLAWDWVQPQSFTSGIIFLIVWGIMGMITDFIAGIIIMAIAANIK